MATRTENFIRNSPTESQAPKERPQVNRPMTVARPHIPRAGHDVRTGPRRMARSLGWLSLGLGLAGTFAAGPLTALVGLRRKQRPLLQAMGIRELLHGFAILFPPDPT